MRSLGAMLVLVTACSDPTLRVSVHHDPAAPAVDQTVVTVYLGEGVTCDGVAHGDFTETELATLTADEVDITDGGRIEVSRIGAKAIVARGFQAKRFVAAGCEDLGEIDDDVDVTIETHAAAVVAIDGGAPDLPFASRAILVTVSDTEGTRLDRTVSWRLSGPAGAADVQPAMGVATSNGVATLRIADLGTPGPQGLRLRVPWTTEDPPLVTAFDLTGPIVLTIPGASPPGSASCAVRGHAGKPPTLVCLQQKAGLANPHRDVVEISWSGTQFTTTTLNVSPMVDNAFAVFVDRDGSADEPIYVVTDDGGGAGTWYRLGGPVAGSPITFSGRLQKLVYIPACKDSNAPAFVALQTIVVDSAVQFHGVTGVQPKPASPVGIASGGCLSDLDGTTRPAAILVPGGFADPNLVVLDSMAMMSTVAVARFAGSGFVDHGGEQRLASTRLQASGTVVFESILAREGGVLKLLERGEVAAAAPPTKILGGKLDADDLPDLMWDMTIGARKRLFQVALGKELRGEALTAITSASDPGTDQDFLVADLDGRGVDEVIVFTPTTVTIFSADD